MQVLNQKEIDAYIGRHSGSIERFSFGGQINLGAGCGEVSGGQSPDSELGRSRFDYSGIVNSIPVPEEQVAVRQRFLPLLSRPDVGPVFL